MLSVRRDVVRRLAPVAVSAGYFALCVGTYAKGLGNGVSSGDTYAWRVTYEHGFVRRGLTGTLLHPWLGSVAETDLNVRLMILNRLLSLACILLTTALLFMALDRVRDSPGLALVAAQAAVAATSGWVAMLALTLGWVDVAVMFVLLLAAVLVAQRRVGLAVLVGTCGSLMHESFAIYWVPLALLVVADASSSQRYRRSPWCLVALLAPAVVGVLSVLFTQRAAAVAEIQALPLDDARKDYLIDVQMGQSPLDAFSSLMSLMHEGWGIAIFSAVAFLGPAVVMAVAFGRTASVPSPWARGALAASIVGPAATLVIASDFSRLLAFAVPLTFVTILTLAQRVELVRRPSSFYVGALAIVAIVGIASPVYFTSPHVIQVWNRTHLYYISSTFNR